MAEETTLSQLSNFIALAPILSGSRVGLALRSSLQPEPGVGLKLSGITATPNRISTSLAIAFFTKPSILIISQLLPMQPESHHGLVPMLVVGGNLVTRSTRYNVSGRNAVEYNDSTRTR